MSEVIEKEQSTMETAIQPISRPADVVPHAAAVLTPMAMINQAVAQGAGIETLEKLMTLQERWEANQARKAFDEAMAAAKAEIPTIAKNRQVGFEAKNGGKNTSYRHEDLAEIARTVDPILGKFGLSYRFRTRNEPNLPITVTCIVTHRDGHSEENTLQAGRDDTGNKNSIQAIGSTITYLQRYTLKAALGLAASNDDDGKHADDDGNAGGRNDDRISAEQAKIILALIEETDSDIQKFCEIGKIDAVPQMFASQFESAVAMLRQKKAKMGQRAAS